MNRLYQKEILISDSLLTFELHCYNGPSHFYHNVISVNQAHTNSILIVKNLEQTFELKKLPHQMIAQDGIAVDLSINDIQNISLCLKTADCLPLVMLGKKFIFLIHAGWRGLEQKIIKNAFKIDPSIYYLFFGPHIREENYEVSLDFADHFPRSNALSAHPFKKEKLLMNLKQQAINQFCDCLQLVDSPMAKIEDSLIDTYSDQTFPSFRRDQTTERIYHYLTIKLRSLNLN